MQKQLQITEIKRAFQDRTPDIFGFAELVKYAILLPLIEVDGKISVLFEVRAKDLRRQPGEICFPGGKVDPEDLDESFAAIRETCEELGIYKENVEILGDLGILVPPYQLAIHTYVGRIKNPNEIKINPSEVAEIFTVPLDELLKSTPEVHYVHLGLKPTESFPYEYIPGGKDYKWRERPIPEYFYFHESRIIWGLTARILDQFLGKVKELTS